MRNKAKSRFIIFLAFVLFFSSFAVSKVNAIEIGDSCPAPRFIPTECPTPYRPGRSGGYTADLNCAASKFTNPGNNCCPNMCVDSGGNPTTTPEVLPEEYNQFEVFGTTIRVNPNNFGTLVNLAFTTFLGLVSIYVILRGIYVAGVKRPNATTDEEIANISKELTNLVIGFVICWSFIIVIQLVANFLGIGRLTDMDFSGGDGSLVITIK